MAKAIVAKIDGDRARGGLARARATCRRWYEKDPSPAVKEWLQILERPWEAVREVLLDPTETGKRLRQSSPFCGVLTAQERWQIYRQFSPTI